MWGTIDDTNPNDTMKNETTVSAAIESSTVLGKTTDYVDTYQPELLYPISRKLGREDIGVFAFEGFDFWRLYEVTWLSPTGLPQIAVGTLKVPATSENIVESKSLKLYVGSFTQSTFDSIDAVQSQMEKDISAVVGSAVEVRLYDVDEEPAVMQFARPDVLALEKTFTETTFTDYEVNADLLAVAAAGTDVVSETLFSNVLRSRCPVTGQPDHASVIVHYEGKTQINAESLLKYLVSFRHHQGFHEQCCEQIFTDLKRVLDPTALTVQCCFTRRGGIDISPLRTMDEKPLDVAVPPRLIRQ